MKKLISLSWTNVLLAIGLGTIVSAFSPLTGAHAVKVYLDNKLVVDEYLGYKGNNTPQLSLDAGDKHEKLIVKYSECGRVVSGRKITAKDEKSNVLKEWRFEGSSKGFEGEMECPVKDLISLRNKTNTVSLYYSSNDFPEGQPFLSLTIGASNATASK